MEIIRCRDLLMADGMTKNSNFSNAVTYLAISNGRNTTNSDTTTHNKLAEIMPCICALHISTLLF